MMDAVKIIECPRDAWQGLKRQIPTLQKVEYLRRLVDAGFRHIDAVSFVSPKVVPQMADSEAVLEQLGPLEGVEIIGIVVNEKGAERAIATGAVSTLGYPCSISETFLRRNQNQSLKQNQALLKKIKQQADEAGLGMVVYISMAFGNPYGDPWSEDKVAQAAAHAAGLGIHSISIADTVGAATPDLIRRVLEAVIHNCAEREVGVAVILVSHFLEDVFQIADVVTILRNGSTVTQRAPCSSLTAESVIESVSDAVNFSFRTARRRFGHQTEPAGIAGAMHIEKRHAIAFTKGAPFYV